MLTLSPGGHGRQGTAERVTSEHTLRCGRAGVCQPGPLGMGPAVTVYNAKVNAAGDTLGLAQSQEQLALHNLFQAGDIPRELYEKVVRRRAPGCETELVTIPTKRKGQLIVQDTVGLWKQYGVEHETEKQAMKSASDVSHGGNRGIWCWNRKGQGCKQWKRCNFHCDCPVQLRAVQIPGGKWVLEVLDVSHGLYLKEYRRANSNLTLDQEALAKSCMDHGMKPNAIKRRANDMAFKMGVTEKQPDGNLIGKQGGVRKGGGEGGSSC